MDLKADELVSDIRIRQIFKDQLRALVSCKIADVFYVTGIRIIQGSQGLFLAMPARKEPNGEYTDIFFPASRQVREMLQQKIITKYLEVVGPDAAVGGQG